MDLLRARTGRRKSMNRTRLQLETLESRENPSGIINVTFTGGTVTLTTAPGFFGDQNVSIVDNGGAGSAKLVANGGETFVSKVGTAFTGVNNIVVNFGPGNDSLLAQHLQISGGLTVNGGSGSNTVNINTGAGDNSFGSVTIKCLQGPDSTFFSGGGTTKIAGKLSIDDGTGSTFTELGTAGTDTVTLGSLSFTAGTGFDDFFTFGTVNVAGDASVNFGNGGATFQWFADSKIGGKFTLSDGTGFDTDNFTSAGNLTVVGATTVNTGNGGSNVFFSPAGTLSLGATTFNGGSGNDAIGFGQAGTSVTLGALTTTTGTGGDAVTLNGASNVVNGAFSVTSLGSDSVTVGGNSLSVTGAFTLKLGNGNDAVSLNSLTSTSISGKAQITEGTGIQNNTIGHAGATVTLAAFGVTMGQGTGTVNFPTVTNASGNVAISHDHGDTNIYLSAAFKTTGALSVTTKDGFVTLDATGATTEVDGATTMTFGNGGSSVLFSSPTSTTLGAFTMKTADGNESLFLQTGTVTAKSISATFGQGTSQVRLDGTTQFTVAGALSVTMLDGTSTIVGDMMTVGGSTTLTTGNGPATIAFGSNNRPVAFNGGVTFKHGHGDYNLALLNVGVAGTTSITAGDGSDQIRVSDSQFQKAVTVHLGDGGDLIAVEATTINGIGTEFHGAVSVTTGGGNDTVSVGLGAGGDSVAFDGAVTMNPGGGVNTFIGLAAIGAGKVTGIPAAGLAEVFQFVN